MRLLGGLIPALAAVAQVNAATNTAAKGDVNMDQVPASAKDPKNIPVSSVTPVMPKVLASSSSIWSSLSSAKSAERARETFGSSSNTSKAGAAKTTSKAGAKTTAKGTSKAATTTKKTTTTKGKAPAKTTAKKAATSKAAAKKNVPKKKVVSKKKNERRQATATSIGAAGTNTGCSINFQNVQGTYTPTPNTPTQFLADTKLINDAAAQWLPPAGYWTSFQNSLSQVMKTGTATSANLYIMYYQVPTYDPSLCAKACDVRDECLGFNMYYSRSPVWEPIYRNASNPNGVCSNPTAVAEVGCGLYFQWIYNSMTTNPSQWRADFALLTQGSNGYNKNPVPARPTNYTKPTALLGAVNGFNAPEYIGYYYWTTGYDNTKCANLCTAYSNQQRQYAIGNKTTTYEACNYFNSFNLTYQGTYQGQYCVLYNDTTVLSNGYMTYTQSTVGTTTYTYNLTNSFGTALYGRDPGTVTPAWSPAPTGTAAACDALGTAGSTLLSIQRQNYTLGCNYDVYQANDIGNSTAADYYSCFDLCDNFSSCSGFSWVVNGDGITGTCYFKDLSTRTTPPTFKDGIDMAWKTSAYAGFNAGKSVQTVKYTTYTTAWTGKSTQTVTSFSDTNGYIIVQTPGATTSAGQLPTTTIVTDSGTASTPITVTSTSGGTITTRIIYSTAACATTSYGASYAFYSNANPGGQNTNSYPAYSPTVYKTKTPTATGVAKWIGEDNSDTAATTIYNRTNIDGRTLVIQHTFYVYAGRGSGRYYFQIPYTDDIQFLWVGDKAISGWTRANADLLQFWTGNPQTPVTASFYLTAGTYTPVRVQWANGGGQGDLQFSVIDPNGFYLAQSYALKNDGYMSPQIVPKPCVASAAAAFPAWGSET